MARQDFELDDNDAETLLAESRGMKPRESVPEIRQYRSVYQTRLVLRVLSLAACVAILVVLFDSLRLYRKTRNVTNPFRAGSGSFPVWPEGLKLYPTHLLVGAAFVAGVFSFVLLLASFNQKVRRLTTTGNVATVVTSVICLALWIAVTVYYETWDTKETNWDLMSWTCTHQDPSFDYENIDFSEFCTKMRFAFWAGVGLAGLEALNLAIFLTWWLGTRHSRGYKSVEGGKAGKKKWRPEGNFPAFS
ncbi:hypothetical protein IQ07DRAFT_684690 [Pyrenochaeta sp. DS3sAY3a]|nr:hypothetical protein IQ07DRAFT_684690 [Pyrenochaeta sp. DS3sAY3a]